MKLMLRMPLRAALVALAVAFALPSLASAALPAVSVVASPGSATVTGADALAPGATRFAIAGAGRTVDVQLVRLNEGRTAEDLLAAAAIDNDGTKLQAIGTFLGGAVVSRGERYAFDLELTAASYVLVATARRPVAVKEFVVSGTPTGEALPGADRTIRLSNFSIAAPPALPRNGAIRVVNDGPSPHFVLGFRLRRAADLRVAIRYLKQGKGRKFAALTSGPPFSLVDLISPGVVNVAHVRLRRGALVLACFYGDSASGGVPHMVLGMVDGVVVR